MKLTSRLEDTNELWDAFNDNNIIEFRKLIKDGLDVNRPNRIGLSLIEHILWDNKGVDKNIIFFDELLSYDKKFESIIKKKFLLTIAFYNKNKKAIHYVKKLLKFNTGVNSFGRYPNQRYGGVMIFDPIIFKVISIFHRHNGSYFLDMFLEKNPDLEYCDWKGDTVINHSIRYHRVKNNYIFSLICKLIKYGADPTQRNYANGHNSLHELSALKQIHFIHIYKKLVNLFLEHGCGINSLDAHGSSPLLLAVYSRNYDMAKILIENGANINISDAYNLNPIFYSTVNKENTMMFDLLFDNNAKLDHISNNGNNILHFLLNRKVYKKYFYEKILGKNPELLFMKNKDGETPIDMIENIENKWIKPPLLSFVRKYC